MGWAFNQKQNILTAKQKCESVLNSTTENLLLLHFWIQRRRLKPSIEINCFVNNFSIGVRESKHRWFTFYLAGRKQAIQCKEALFSERTVFHGAPQGAVLGPVLFWLCTNNTVGGNRNWMCWIWMCILGYWLTTN